MGLGQGVMVVEFLKLEVSPSAPLHMGGFMQGVTTAKVKDKGHRLEKNKSLHCMVSCIDLTNI